MYKVIVIDDEFIVVEGLKKHIDWEKFGFQLVDWAFDGVSGLDKIRQHQPDLVITDIRMPGLDGLGMIEKGRRECPDTVFAIISGYADFEYARRALKMGLIDYIDKPVTIENINGLLLRVRTKLDSRKEQSELSQRLPTLERDLLVRQLQEYLHNESNYPPNDLSYARVLSVLGYPYNNPSDIRQVMVITGYTNNDIFQHQGEIFEQIAAAARLAGLIALTAQDGDYINLIIFTLKKSWTVPEIRQLLESVIQPSESESLTVSIGVGGFGTQLSDLHRSWLESGKALRYASILDEVGVFIYDDLEDRSKVPQISINDKDSLLLNLRKVDRDAVMRQLRQYMEQLRLNRVAPEILTHECLKLIYLGLSVLSEAGLTDTLPLSRKLLPHEEIARFHTFDQIAGWVEQSFQTMLEQLQKARENTSHSAVQVVRSFLEQHYMEEFSLNELAEKVGLNATYLSILFRDEVGQSYIRYLTRLRLDKARQLLEQGQKINDVCKQVGYNNYRYFCDLFRKQIGMTPGDYKNQFRH